MGRKTIIIESSSYTDSKNSQVVECEPGVARTVTSSSSYEAVVKDGDPSFSSLPNNSPKNKKTEIYLGEEPESTPVAKEEDDPENKDIKRRNYNILGSLLIVMSIVAFVVTFILTFFFAEQCGINKDFAYIILMIESSLPFFITSLQPHHTTLMRSLSLILGTIVFAQACIVLIYMKF